jgi:hypothetical protein
VRSKVWLLSSAGHGTGHGLARACHIGGVAARLRAVDSSADAPVAVARPATHLAATLLRPDPRAHHRPGPAAAPPADRRRRQTQTQSRAVWRRGPYRRQFRDLLRCRCELSQICRLAPRSRASAPDRRRRARERDRPATEVAARVGRGRRTGRFARAGAGRHPARTRRGKPARRPALAWWSLASPSRAPLGGRGELGPHSVRFAPRPSPAGMPGVPGADIAVARKRLPRGTVRAGFAQPPRLTSIPLSCPGLHGDSSRSAAVRTRG